MIAKANMSSYGAQNYSQPTWASNSDSVLLNDGYSFKFQPDGSGGSMFYHVR